MSFLVASNLFFLWLLLFLSVSSLFFYSLPSISFLYGFFITYCFVNVARFLQQPCWSKLIFSLPILSIIGLQFYRRIMQIKYNREWKAWFLFEVIKLSQKKTNLNRPIICFMWAIPEYFLKFFEKKTMGCARLGRSDFSMGAHWSRIREKNSKNLILMRLFDF